MIKYIILLVVALFHPNLHASMSQEVANTGPINVPESVFTENNEPFWLSRSLSSQTCIQRNDKGELVKVELNKVKEVCPPLRAYSLEIENAYAILNNQKVAFCLTKKCKDIVTYCESVSQECIETTTDGNEYNGIIIINKYCSKTLVNKLIFAKCMNRYGN